MNKERFAELSEAIQRTKAVSRGKAELVSAKAVLNTGV
jgi:hypothetical protein